MPSTQAPLSQSSPALQGRGSHPAWVGYLEQAPAPSHWPSRSQTAAPLSRQLPFGSVSATTGPQVPSLPEPLSAAVHAVHMASHGVSQQTPSAHAPDAQVTPAVQG